MLLLLGGTSETAPVATALARAGHRVLVSTATDIPLDVGEHPSISRRMGRLPEAEMVALIREKAVRAIVDVTHPYAAHVRATAERVAGAVGIPYLTLVRPGVLAEGGDARRAADHEEAARIACGFGRPVLLTVGSKNVASYAKEAQRRKAPLVARVLSHPDSIEACRRAGIPEERIITGRGPFSVEENRCLIRQFGIGVVVTKDSGDAGGVREKAEAARLEGCRLVVVERPAAPSAKACDGIEALLRELSRQLMAASSSFP